MFRIFENFELSPMDIQCSLFITLCLGSIGMDCIISEPAIKGQFSYHSFENSMVKNLGAST